MSFIETSVVSPALAGFASEVPSEVPKPPWRILLVQSAQGLYESSGGYRANLALLRALSSQGHAVKMIATAYERDIERLPANFKKNNTTFNGEDLAVYRFAWDELEVVALGCEKFKDIFESVEAAHKRRQWLLVILSRPYALSLQKFSQEGYRTMDIRPASS